MIAILLQAGATTLAAFMNCFVISMILVLGRTQTGKTTCITRDLLQDARPKIWLDPQGSMAPMAAKHTLKGIYEKVAGDIAIPSINLWESNETDPIKKRAADKILRDDHLDLYYGRRKVDPLVNHLIVEVAELLAKTLQYQKEYKPAYWLPEMVHGQLMASCHDGATQQSLCALLYLSPTQKRKDIDPAQRLIRPVTSLAAFMRRCGRVDITDVIRSTVEAEEDIYVEGGGATDDEIFTVLLNWMYGGIRYVERFGGPLVICCDEVSNWGIPGTGFFVPKVLQALKTLEKAPYFLEFVFCLQSLHALEPNIQAELLDQARIIVAHAIGSPETAKILAEVMTKIDPYKVHHVDERKRQVHDGYDYEVMTNHRLPGSDDKGSKTEVTQARARYREETDRIEYYQPLNDQTKITQHDLMNLQTGERFVCNKEAGIWREKVPLLKDPWPFGLSDLYLQEFIESMGENKWFHQVEYQEPPISVSRVGKKGGK